MPAGAATSWRGRSSLSSPTYGFIDCLQLSWAFTGKSCPAHCPGFLHCFELIAWMPRLLPEMALATLGLYSQQHSPTGSASREPLINCRGRWSLLGYRRTILTHQVNSSRLKEQTREAISLAFPTPEVPKACLGLCWITVSLTQYGGGGVMQKLVLFLLAFASCFIQKMLPCHNWCWCSFWLNAESARHNSHSLPNPGEGNWWLPFFFFSCDRVPFGRYSTFTSWVEEED